MNIPAPVFPVLPTEKVRTGTITVDYIHHDGTSETVIVEFPLSLYLDHIPAPVAAIIDQRLEAIAKSRGFSSGRDYNASCKINRRTVNLLPHGARGVPHVV